MRADRMLVDGVMVVHVELHLRDDAAEIGNEAAEDAASFIQRAPFPDRADCPHVEEEGDGLRVGATCESTSFASRAARASPADGISSS
jgi:hypothetical protein